MLRLKKKLKASNILELIIKIKRKKVLEF